jgi:methyl-accepting chemotaxis protein
MNAQIAQAMENQQSVAEFVHATIGGIRNSADGAAQDSARAVALGATMSTTSQHLHDLVARFGS